MPADHSTITRRGFLGAGIALGGLALAGCVSPGNESAGSSPSAALKAGGKASGEISILDDNTNKVFKNGLIDVFEKRTGIKVKNYEMANFNDLHDRFSTMFAGKDSSYDVIMTWAGWSAEFGQAGWLQPIDRSSLPADVIRPALDAVSWDHTVYGLPKFASVQTMFWNKDHFEKAGLDPNRGPENWNDFVAAAKKLTAGGRYGFTCDMGNPAGAYQNYLRTMLLCGGRLYDAQWNPQLTSEAGIEAMTKLVELYRLHKVMDPASLQITNASDLVDVFAQENTSIVFNWPFQWAVATARSAKTSAATVGNGLLPGINVRSASIDGSEGYAINRYSKNKAAAMKWLEFAASATSQQRIVDKEGWFPVSEKILDDPATAKALPVVTTYKKSTKYVTKRYGTPWSNELDQLMSVHVNRAMNGSETPRAAMTAVQEKLKPLVAKYMG